MNESAVSSEIGLAADGSASPALSDWPVRPWLLAGLLGLAGLLIHLVNPGQEDVPWRMAAATFLAFGSLAAAFTIERERWREPAIFALAAGLVMAGLAWRAVQYSAYLPDAPYGFAAGMVATGLALPLFQAGFHRRRLATSYAEIYGHVWTDAISVAGALAFTGLSWLVLALLAELFHLLRIDLLRELMDEGAFGWTFSGLAAGAALGTIRNQLKVLATMQALMLLVASLLAVPLAAGLVLFLLATALSGPQVLWDATRSATPLLLACAAGAYVLANAIVRQTDEAMTHSRVMCLAGWVLAALILPLAVFAALSMGLRLQQYGLAPERLWGLATIIVACACGVGYWVALARGRLPRRQGGRPEGESWPAYLRTATFHSGLGVCALALLLALPVLDFGAIATRNQLSRLESGRVEPEAFDYAALRWDFGEAGREALRRLARSDDKRIAELAEAAQAQTRRYSPPFGETAPARTDFDLRVQPEDASLRKQVLQHLAGNPWACEKRCVALDLGPGAGGMRRVAIVQESGYYIALLSPDGSGVREPDAAPPANELREDSVVEIRDVPTPYIFIDGKRLPQPVASPRDSAAGPLEGGASSR